MDSQLQKLFEERAYGKPVIIPKFFLHARKDIQKSTLYGINIYQNEMYVQIKTKGRNDNTVRKATEEDIQVFSHAHELFLQELGRKSQSLEQLPGYTPAIGFTFRDVGVTTVEELLAYRGPFPTAEMKKLWHVAAYLQSGMRDYQAPVFYDETVENSHGEIRPPDGADLFYTQGGADGGNLGERVPVSQPASNGSGGEGPLRYGAVFDENGQVSIENY